MFRTLKKRRVISIVVNYWLCCLIITFLVLWSVTRPSFTRLCCLIITFLVLWSVTRSSFNKALLSHYYVFGTVITD